MSAESPDPHPEQSERTVVDVNLESLNLLAAYFAPLRAPFEGLSSHSFAVVAWLYVSGFVITGIHFARTGVPFASLPATKLFSAGVIFTLVTLFFFYIGVSIPTAYNAGWKKFRSIVGALSGAGYLLNMSRVGWSVWLIAFGLFVAAVGWRFGHKVFRERQAGESATAQAEDHPAFNIATRVIWPVSLVTLFAAGPYVVLDPAIGGGRPAEVIVDWSNGPRTVCAECSLFLLHESDEVLYLAEENPSGIDDGAIFKFLDTRPIRPRYFSVSREDVARLSYAARSARTSSGQRDSGPSLEEPKALIALELADLVTTPIWYVDESDGAAHPASSTSAVRAAEVAFAVVLTEFTLADGTQHLGYSNPGNACSVEYTRPVILTPRGQVPLVTEGPDEHAIGESLLARLGRKTGDVFPLRWTTVVAVGGSFPTGLVDGFAYVRRGDGTGACPGAELR